MARTLPVNDLYKVNFNIILGDNICSTTYFGRDRSTKAPVAVKVFQVKSIEDIKNVKSEVTLLKKLKHENIVKCLEAVGSETYICVVLEFIEKGHTLVDLFRPSSFATSKWDVQVTEADVHHIIYQITEALYYAMTKKICHRDVKLDNVLVRDFQTFDVVLGNFTMSRELDKTSSLMRTDVGTPGFVSPEILNNKAYNYKCDIWSLGVMFYALLSWGFPPYIPTEKELKISEYEAIFHKLPKLSLKFIPNEQFDNCSEESKHLLKWMLQVDPRRRYPYKKIRNHTWYYDDAIAGDIFDLNSRVRNGEDF